MPFVIDDIAVCAAEVAEAAESVEAISEEMAATEFDASNFGSELPECDSPEFGNLEDRLGAERSESSIESEFSPENFQEAKESEQPQLTDSEQSIPSDETTNKETTEPIENEKSNEVKQIKTINSGLEGQNHPVTNVEFERKVVTTETGEKVEGVFPKFESKFDAQLPKDLELASDAEQFNECNRQLKEKYDSDPTFREQFDERQKENIEDGYTPYGYTWHHNEETGKMQLVDYDTHQKTAHTGGRSIWGGGSDFR